MNNRQKQLIENYIRLKVKKVISEKKSLKESGNSSIFFNYLVKLYQAHSSTTEDIQIWLNATKKFQTYLQEEYNHFDSPPHSK